MSYSRRIVIREPKEGASPCQLINELAFLTYLAKHHPSIPVPQVYTYNLNTAGLDSPYVAMEYIEGEPLDAAWGRLSETSKETITDDIAQIVLEMGAIDLGGIGGLTLEHKLGPTVEGVKFFRGRVCNLEKEEEVESNHQLTFANRRKNSTHLHATISDRTSQRLITP